MPNACAERSCGGLSGLGSVLFSLEGASPVRSVARQAGLASIVHRLRCFVAVSLRGARSLYSCTSAGYTADKSPHT